MSIKQSTNHNTQHARIEMYNSGHFHKISQKRTSQPTAIDKQCQCCQICSSQANSRVVDVVSIYRNVDRCFFVLI